MGTRTWHPITDPECGRRLSKSSFRREPGASADVSSGMTSALAPGSRRNFLVLLDFTSRVHYHACLVPPRFASLRETAWVLYPPLVVAASHGAGSFSARGQDSPPAPRSPGSARAPGRRPA